MKSLVARLLFAGCLLAGTAQALAQSLQVPAGAGAMAPHLAPAPDGRLVLSWLAPVAQGHALRFSIWQDRQWAPRQEVAQGNDWFVNWADFPSVVPIADNLWAAHWLRRSADAPYAYDVQLALSLDGGQTWGKPLTPHQDGTPTEHGFVSLFPASGGIGAIWLDGRNTAGHGTGAMTLRYGRVSRQGEVTESYLMDGRVCDCCQTDVTLAASGPVAVFRDRSEAEIRDIGVIRMVEDRWQQPQTVADDGWEVAGCPVNGPAIAAVGNQVVVAWFTEAGAKRQLRAAWSEDSGKRFAPFHLVAEDAPLGRADVALDAAGQAWVLWMRESVGGQAELKMRSLTSDGMLGQEFTVAENAATRAAGFPQLAIISGTALVVWTDAGQPQTRLRGTQIALASIRQ